MTAPTIADLRDQATRLHQLHRRAMRDDDDVAARRIAWRLARVQGPNRPSQRAQS